MFVALVRVAVRLFYDKREGTRLGLQCVQFVHAVRASGRWNLAAAPLRYYLSAEKTG
jgi:hypothetical protein